MISMIPPHTAKDISKAISQRRILNMVESSSFIGLGVELLKFGFIADLLDLPHLELLDLFLSGFTLAINNVLNVITPCSIGFDDGDEGPSSISVREVLIVPQCLLLHDKIDELVGGSIVLIFHTFSIKDSERNFKPLLR